MGKVRILLDTNIVLDYFTGRMGDGNAARLVQVGRSARYEMCISFLTAVNVMYVMRKLNAEVRPSDLTRYFNILPQDASQWEDAETLEMSDFEDAVQAACALRNECYVAISRDHHFRSAPMPVFTPEEFLSIVLEGDE